MGLLLNVSRRNLDRVLYFAQYVVTSVDDDARERALVRLDEELVEAEAQLEIKLHEQVAEVTVDVTSRVAALDDQLEELNLTFDDRLETETDAFMKEAQMVQTRLENLQGSVTKEDIVFVDELVAKKGETVGREHIVLVQDLASDQLTGVQQAFEERHQSQVADLQRELVELRAEIDAAAEESARADGPEAYSIAPAGTDQSRTAGINRADVFS